MPHVLLVDDDSDAVLSLARALRLQHIDADIHGVSRSETAKEFFVTEHPEVVVLDLHLDSRGVDSGFALLKELLLLDESTRIVMLTGHGSTEHGVRALTLGAAHFLTKPADISHLTALVRDGLAQAKIRRAAKNFKETFLAEALDTFVGKSAAAQKIREEIYYLASHSEPVLLYGETGTGKGLCAALIHTLSARRAKAFVRYQPSLTSGELAHSELFGHRKGAFTGALEERAGLFAAAHGGTLFLDELEELPAATQVALLGVLQEKRYRTLGADAERVSDARLITASNQAPEDLLRTGALRKDLYHRLQHCFLTLPPLRERAEDIPILAEHTLRAMVEEEKVAVRGFADDFFANLPPYDWPGNVRELDAVVRAATLRAKFCGDSVVRAAHVRIGHVAQSPNGSFHSRVEEFKRRLVLEALRECGDNQVHTAARLGVDRSTLRRILGRQPEG